MLQGLRSCPVLCCLLLVLDLPLKTNAQALLSTDTYAGGVVTGAFSIGNLGNGYGVVDMALPLGATVHKATLYSVCIGCQPNSTLDFNLGPHPISFNDATAGPAFNSLYGPVVLHSMDLTNDLDPSVTGYAINLLGTTTNFKEFMLIVQYELPGALPITVDLFHCNKDSQLQEEYNISSSFPMSTAAPIVFATMGSYSLDYWNDCEHVKVNGTDLGRYYGGDYNTPPTNGFGASATFHYANGIFEGIGDDDIDQAIDGADVLSDLAGLLPDNSTDLTVTYEHCFTSSPFRQTDNIVNLMVLAYAAAPCAIALDLGPDTTLCAGNTLVLDASTNEVTYRWQDGSTTPTFTVQAAGTYHVTLSKPGCDVVSDTILVDMMPLPVIALGADRTLCTNTTTTLGTAPEAGTVYRWSDGNADVPRTIDTAGTYTLVAMRAGCSATDSIRITEVDCSYAVELPNIFTPNGDGTNAQFRPVAMYGVRSLSLSVYNRWGQLMFNSTSLRFAWDGRTTTGDAAPDGVYFWMLEHEPEQTPGTRVATHGTVTLLR